MEKSCENENFEIFLLTNLSSQGLSHVMGKEVLQASLAIYCDRLIKTTERYTQECGATHPTHILSHDDSGPLTAGHFNQFTSTYAEII